MIPQLKHTSPVEALYVDFLRELTTSGFKGDITQDYANRIALSTDNSVYQVLPQSVIYPRNTDDLVKVAQLAGQAKFRQVVLSPRGGGTGTNAQSLTDGIVVDLSKHMNSIIEINETEGWVRVQSGVVKDQLNAALKPRGLFFAPELSTSNRATIGGMISTDASGQGSCLYGKTRDHVIELQTVLLDGSVLNSRALENDELDAIIEQQDLAGIAHRVIDNIFREHKTKIDEIFPPLNRCLTGYDLAHIRDENDRFNLNNIICGSEGTLGFVTEAKLNVLPIPKYFMLVVVKYDDFNSSLRDAASIMSFSPTSIETIDSKVLKLAMNDFVWHQVEEFFTDEVDATIQGVNLVEFTGDDEQELRSAVDRFTESLTDSLEDNNTGRLGYAIAEGKDAVNRIWGMRKRAVGLLGNIQGNARPVPFVEDTAVPPEELADFILEFREILDAYNLEYGMFGHVDTGVLHVRPALDMRDPEQENIAWEISDRIADLTFQYHGLFWGEHGKGVRSEYSPQFFGELYPELQRIKSLFDPYNQLNPGKIATPAKNIELLKIDEVPTRGQQNRFIPVQAWEVFHNAVDCNGNGACFNWNAQDAMCPSWKGTRNRVYSPKGRASLVREWLKLLSDNGFDPTEELKPLKALEKIKRSAKKLSYSLQAKTGQYDFSHEVYDSMATCLACKACAGQCPVKVDVPEFRSKFLALYHTRYMRPLKDYLVGSLEFALPVYAKAPVIYNRLVGNKLVQRILEKFVGFVDGPALTGIKLKKSGVRFATNKTLQSMDQSKKLNTVIIVQDAFTSYFETKLVIDTVRLLEGLGFNALLAPYKANGKPLHVHGFLQKFAVTARKNANMLAAFSTQGIPLVGIDPSMTLTYRSEYKEILGDDTPPVMLLQEWLASRLKELNIEKPGTGTIHYRLLPHCTEASNAADSLKLWQQVFSALGHTLELIDVGCCGMSGTYGHETRNRSTSTKIYGLSWRKPVENFSDNETLLATGYSCRSQARRESAVTLLHPVQALLRSINVAEQAK